MPGDANAVLAGKWRGLALPVTRHGGNHFRTSGSFDIIWTSILLILMTPRGMRLYDPDFGSRLHELVFEPNDAVLASMANYYIRDALADGGEDRVEVREVRTLPEEDSLGILILFGYAGEAYEGRLSLRRHAAFTLLSQSCGKAA